jgi:hypothetical protein
MFDASARAEELTPRSRLRDVPVMDRSSRTRAGRRWSVLGALFAAALLATPASAQVPGEEIARRAFEEGVGLEKKNDFAGALTKFKESSAIKATLGNRFHIAYCLEMTGKLAAALIEYEIVDKTAREQSKADVIEATRVRLEPLRAKVPQLGLKAAQPLPKDAEVTLDGASVSPALLDGKAFRIDPGEHTVVARAPEHDSFTKQLTAPEGATIAVDIVLMKSSAKAGTSPPGREHMTEPPPEALPGRSNMLPILTTAGAVVLAGGGVIAFILAGSAQSDAEKTCPTRPTCDDEKSSVRTLDAVALAGFIGAAGLTALSVVLWTSRPTASASAAGIKARAAVSWIGLEGRF